MLAAARCLLWRTLALILAELSDKWLSECQLPKGQSAKSVYEQISPFCAISSGRRLHSLRVGIGNIGSPRVYGFVLRRVWKSLNFDGRLNGRNVPVIKDGLRSSAGLTLALQGDILRGSPNALSWFGTTSFAEASESTFCFGRTRRGCYFHVGRFQSRLRHSTI